MFIVVFLLFVMGLYGFIYLSEVQKQFLLVALMDFVTFKGAECKSNFNFFFVFETFQKNFPDF